MLAFGSRTPWVGTVGTGGIVKKGTVADNGCMSATRGTAHCVEQTIGAHHGRLDGDIVVLTLNGSVSETEAIAIMDFLLRHDPEDRRLGLLVLIPGSFSVTHPARKVLVNSSRSDRPAIPMAVVGGVARVIITLLLNAIRILLRKDVPVRFCSNETEGRHWLREQIPLRAKRASL